MPHVRLILRSLTAFAFVMLGSIAAMQDCPACDRYRDAFAQGQALFAKNQYPEAIDKYQAALAIASQLNDQQKIATCDRAIGLSHYRQGHVPLALDFYRRGVPAAEASGDKRVLAELLRGVGLAERGLGNREAAIDATTRSLALSRDLNDFRSIAGMLSNLALMAGDEGDLRREGALLTESLHVAEANHLDDMVRSAYDNLGILYLFQGDLPVAIDYLEKTLRLREAAHDPDRDISAVLNNLALVYTHLGRYDDAFAYYTRSLTTMEPSGDQRRIADIRLNRGSLLRRRGSYAEALAELERGRELFEQNGILEGRGEVLTNLALVHLALGDPDRALTEARSAVSIARKVGDKEALWSALDSLGRSAARAGMRDEARTAYREAVDVVEGMRRGLTGGVQQGEFFLSNKMSVYHGLIALAVDDHEDVDAWRIAEQSKARQLFDVLSGGRVAVTKSMTPAEKTRETQLAATVASLDAQAARSAGPSAALDDQRARAVRALDGFRAELYAAHPELQMQRGAFQPLSLADTTALLPDARTALIEYVVGDESTFVFLLKRGADGAPSLSVRRIAWPRRDLERDVEDFGRRLAAHDLEYRPLAGSLYRRLLQPFDAQLRGTTLLAIVPDGALWSLPFQALVSPSGRHVVEDRAVFYAPSLTTLRESRRARTTRAAAQPRTLLAMGGPSLSGLDLHLPPLPESAREARDVAALYGSERGVVFTGADAREDRWKAEAPRYRVLHLATHGLLNGTNPLYSYVVLDPGRGGDDSGLLDGRKILDLDLHADLTVLSACETARGQISGGEGLVGMSWAFLVAGSPTTVVSQWSVVDASTRRLMVAFHRHLLQDEPNALAHKARALQLASQELLRTSAFRHPFYWSAFSMIGDGY